MLDRYEMLYEAGLIEEARRDGRAAALARDKLPALGEPMRFDHRRILATAIARLRAKLKYRPVVFELMPAEFTLTELQHTVEAISGRLCTSRISAGWSRAPRWSSRPARPRPRPAGGRPRCSASAARCSPSARRRACGSGDAVEPSFSDKFTRATNSCAGIGRRASARALRAWGQFMEFLGRRRGDRRARLLR